ncbi:unnamed protein product [Trichobilharzia regenti]|nr:unnamed protein product [Trichobilharzia regenti]
MFIIVHEKNGKIESSHSSTASSSFVEPSAQQHSVRLALPKAPRLLAKRHTNEFRSDLHLSSPVSPTWNKLIGRGRDFWFCIQISYLLENIAHQLPVLLENRHSKRKSLVAWYVLRMYHPSAFYIVYGLLAVGFHCG